MNPALQSAIATGVVGIILLILNQRANRRSEAATNALTGRRVDVEGKAVDLAVLVASIDELKEARADDHERLEQAEDRVRILEEQLQAEREARVAAERRAAAAEQRAAEAGNRAGRLERRVTQLEATLRANNITVPSP